MAYAPSTVVPRELGYREDTATNRDSRGRWRRLFDAMIELRQRQAEHEIALYLQRTGGKFTDEVEREIGRRFIFSR